MSKGKRRARRTVADARTKSHAALALQPKTVDAAASGLPAGLFTMDEFSNPLARLGGGRSQNLMNASEYNINRFTADYALLNALYRNEWIAKRIIDTPAKDMTKNWFKLDTSASPDAVKRLEQMQRRTKIKKRITQALQWSRLYGGAACIMIIDGQQDMLDEPLDVEMVTPGSFCGLIVLDRWSGIAPSAELELDYRSPMYGQPKYYTITDGDLNMYNIKVHASRVLLFNGRELPKHETITETYWGASELEHVFTELKKRDNTSANIANLIFQANIRVLKMGELGQLLAGTSRAQQEELYRTLQSQNTLMNNNAMQIMDKDDSYEAHSYTFAGISDIYELFMLDIAGASEIPATKLFGREPAGMNATGESDLVNYYDSIAEKQESDLRPALEQLLPVMCMSEFGCIPDDIEIKFNPVRTVSEQEKANIVQQTAAAINGAFTAGIISQKTALMEYRSQAETTGLFSTIDDDVIDNADDGTSSQGGEALLPSAFGGGTNEDKESTPDEHTLTDDSFDDDSSFLADGDGWKKQSRASNGQFGSGGSGGAREVKSKGTEKKKENENWETPRNPEFKTEYKRPNLSKKDYDDLKKGFEKSFRAEDTPMDTRESPEANKQQLYSRRLKSVKTPNGVKVKALSEHAMQRLAQRSSFSEMTSILEKPMMVGVAKHEKGDLMAYVGWKKAVLVNPASGVIVTITPLNIVSCKIRSRREKKK